jgi:hypothetical protein
MWRLYTQTQDAVAIRSSYQRLVSCLPDEALIGLVHYVDFEETTIAMTNRLAPFAMKRKSFEHEREVRAVIIECPFWDGGDNYSVVTGEVAPPFKTEIAARISGSLHGLSRRRERQ